MVRLLKNLLKALLMKYVADITLRMACLISYTGEDGRLHYKLYATNIPIWIFDSEHRIGTSLGNYRFIAPGWWATKPVTTVGMLMLGT